MQVATILSIDTWKPQAGFLKAVFLSWQTFPNNHSGTYY